MAAYQVHSVPLLLTQIVPKICRDNIRAVHAVQASRHWQFGVSFPSAKMISRVYMAAQADTKLTWCMEEDDSKNESRGINQDSYTSPIMSPIFLAGPKRMLVTLYNS